MFNRKLSVNPRFLIPVAVTFVVILITVTAFDIFLSYKDIYRSKTEEAVSLLRAVQKSGENAYLSSVEVENLITEKLINSAYLISLIEQTKKPDIKTLNTISENNNIDHIYLFDSRGNLEAANSNNIYSELNVYKSFSSEVDSIVSGKYDYYVAGSVPDEKNIPHLLILHKRQAVNSGGLIALSAESDYLLRFRREIGVGKLFQRIADGKDIEYIVIQDSTGIITASEGIENLSSFESDKFPAGSISQKKILTREIYFNNKKILEAVKPFRTGGDISGVIRVGVSLDPIRSLMNWTILRSIVVSLILLFVGIVVIVFITNSQSYSLLRSEFRKVKSYTEKVLENMSDAVIVTDSKGIINLFNTAAENIFGLKADAVKGKDCRSIIKDKESFIEATLRTQTAIDYSEHIVTSFSGRQLVIGGSTSILYSDNNKIEAVIAVVRDITGQKNLEEIQKRQEKLSAMGELAAGVAHEIKNPLNLVGIAAQRLEKEFTPPEENKDSGEYREIIKTMKQEIQRVTDIINQFLKFARPRKVNKGKTDIKEFMEDIFQSFQAKAAQTGISLSCNCNEIYAEIDQGQMRQALVNLVQNAFDAVSEEGKVLIEALKEGDHLIIKVSDNGSGISAESINRIFNIYFTTKPNGTGLGLSIVNQIVTEHGGQVKVISSPETGTIFTIELPL